jgi:ABC-type branched-subunit amino acid transport system substrate-binding protein
MSKYLAVVAAALLLSVGCTSGSDSASSSTTAAKATDSAADSRAPGVTDDSIKIGITYIDFEAIKQFTKVRHGDYEGSYRALIDELNAKGGINGRKIEPVFAPVSPIGTDAADAACVKLTEDEDVFIVMGFFQGDTVLCVVDAHETAVLGGAMTEERLARAKAPWFTMEPGGDSDLDAIRALAKAGKLDGKLGVVATNQGEASLRKVAEPLLKKLGVHPTEVAVIDAPDNDAAAQDAAVHTIAERFRSSGVDKVLVYGQAGLTWANAMASDSYRPQLLFTGLDAILSYSNDANKDTALLQGALAVAGERVQGDPNTFDPSLRPCFDAIEKATGVKIVTQAESDRQGTPYNFIAPSSACANLALFQAIAEKAGSKLDYGTFRKAGESLGKVTLPGGADPFHFGPPPHADGDPVPHLNAWDPKTRKFVPQD